jgi:hypothetical protein
MASEKRTFLSNVFIETSRVSKKVMVSVGVCWKGKTRIHFIDTEKTKVNSVNYMKLLDDGLLPDCRNVYPRGRLHVHVSAGWSHISYK